MRRFRILLRDYMSIYKNVLIIFSFVFMSCCAMNDEQRSYSTLMIDSPFADSANVHGYNQYASTEFQRYCFEKLIPKDVVADVLLELFEKKLLIMSDEEAVHGEESPADFDQHIKLSSLELLSYKPIYEKEITALQKELDEKRLPLSFVVPTAGLLAISFGSMVQFSMLKEPLLNFDEVSGVVWASMMLAEGLYFGFYTSKDRKEVKMLRQIHRLQKILNYIKKFENKPNRIQVDL